MRTTVKRLILSAALTTGLIGAFPATANAYSATAICGSDGYSYTVLTSSPVTAPNGTVVGTVYLAYSSGNGENCVVTIKSSYVGSSTWTGADLTVQNVGDFYDNNNYSYYAGPVRKYAAGHCVKYQGIMNMSDGTTATGGNSAWSYCN